MEIIIGIGAVVAVFGYVITTSRAHEHGKTGRAAYRAYCRERGGDQIGNRGYELNVGEARVFIGLFRGDPDRDPEAHGSRFYARLPLPGPRIHVSGSATAERSLATRFDRRVLKDLNKIGFIRFLKCDGDQLILDITTIYSAPSAELDRAVAVIGALGSAKSLYGSEALEALRGRYQPISGSFKKRRPPSVVVTRRGLTISIAPIFDQKRESLHTEAVARAVSSTLINAAVSSDDQAAIEGWPEDLRAIAGRLGEFELRPTEAGLALRFPSIVSEVARLETAIELLVAHALPRPTGAYR